VILAGLETGPKVATTGKVCCANTVLDTLQVHYPLIGTYPFKQHILGVPTSKYPLVLSQEQAKVGIPAAIVTTGVYPVLHSQ